MNILGDFDYKMVDYSIKLENKNKLPLFVVSYLDQIKDGLDTDELCEITNLIKISDILIDFSHGMLNTNLWVFVDDTWRFVYGFAILYKIILMCKKYTLIKMKSDYLVTGVIKLCDLGLLMSGNLLEDLFNQILNKIKQNNDNDNSKNSNEKTSSNTEKLEKNELHPILNNKYLIKSEKSPSVNLFKENYFQHFPPLYFVQYLPFSYYFTTNINIKCCVYNGNNQIGKLLSEKKSCHY